MRKELGTRGYCQPELSASNYSASIGRFRVTVGQDPAGAVPRAPPTSVSSSERSVVLVSFCPGVKHAALTAGSSGTGLVDLEHLLAPLLLQALGGAWVSPW